MADYWTLLTRESKWHPWEIHAGSYRRSEMVYEQRETKLDTRLIKTGDAQADILVEMRRLNRARLVELASAAGIEFTRANWEVVRQLLGQEVSGE